MRKTSVIFSALLFLIFGLFPPGISCREKPKVPATTATPVQDVTISPPTVVSTPTSSFETVHSNARSSAEKERKVVIFVLDSGIDPKYVSGVKGDVGNIGVDSHGTLVARIITMQELGSRYLYEYALEKKDYKLIKRAQEALLEEAKTFSEKEYSSKYDIISINTKADKQGKISAGKYVTGLLQILDFVKENPGAAVIVNISLGSYEHLDLEDAIIAQLSDMGVIVVAAAGNDNRREPQYPAASDERVVAVTESKGSRRAPNSNYGSHIDIATELSELEKQSLKRMLAMKELPPELRQDFLKPLPPELEKKLLPMIKYLESLISIDGTSFVAPKVAGILGYMLLKNPELTPKRAAEIIKETAAPIKHSYYEEGQLGAGLLDPLAAFRKAGLPISVGLSDLPPYIMFH